MNGLSGKVALITGAARGQGRSHAVALAAQGVHIVALDFCQQLDSVPYPLATPEDLDLTAKEISAVGGQVLARQVDVRDRDGLQGAVDDAMAEFGRLDIVIPNAGIAPLDVTEPDPVQRFHDVIDINLTGVWNTTHIAVPAILAGGRGGSVVFISSTAGLRGCIPGLAAGDAYVAAKHGVVGLMRNLANAHAQDNLRVNTIHPTGVRTPMVENDALARMHEASPQSAAAMSNLLPVDMVEAADITNAVVWLCSDLARYVTGVSLPVDAGYSTKM